MTRRLGVSPMSALNSDGQPSARVSVGVSALSSGSVRSPVSAPLVIFLNFSVDRHQ